MIDSNDAEGREGHWCLRHINGPTSWNTWPISETPASIGRGMGVLVRLDDVSISRVQCEIALSNGFPELTNKGTKNPTRVNGMEVAHIRLQLGDVVSMGKHRFIVDFSTKSSEIAGTTSIAALQDTTLNSAQLRFRTEAIEQVSAEHLMGYSSDLLAILQLLRILVRSRTLDELAEVLGAHLQERYRDAKVSFFWRMDAGDMLFPIPAPAADEVCETTLKIAQKVCAEGHAVLHHGTSLEREHVLCAPLDAGAGTIGALSLTNTRGNSAFTELDLHFLLALAEYIAPIALATNQRHRMELDLRESLPESSSLDSRLIGASEVTTRFKSLLLQVAPLPCSILVLGETGVGKELVARLLHDHSSRPDAPYVAVNCAAIPTELFESEVFGHERGSFTGAGQTRKGLFELAHGGTLFLDEIGELSPLNQAKLLRVTETGTIRRVGGTKEIQVNVRLVSATNRVLPEVGPAGFRMDLYHRISGVTLLLPPLRERLDDVLPLARHFAVRVNPPLALREPIFSDTAIEQLLAYSWPGNARELKNVVERAVLLSTQLPISNIDLPNAPNHGPGTKPKHQPSLVDMERDYLVSVMKESCGVVMDAALTLGIPASTLYYKLRKLGIRASDYARPKL